MLRERERELSLFKTKRENMFQFLLFVFLGSVAALDNGLGKRERELGVRVGGYAIRHI
jgi:hypothetical protein